MTCRSFSWFLFNTTIETAVSSLKKEGSTGEILFTN